MAIVLDIDAAVAEMALPEVVDSAAVVLLGLLAGGGRPVVLDASRVRTLEPSAAPLLLSLLRSTRAVGYEARITGASPRLRSEHPALALFFAADVAEDEFLFLAPDLDGAGFAPSSR
jgi:hypothetical protein